jgi:hypothetical protein
LHVVASKSYAAGGAGSWSNRKTGIALPRPSLGGADDDENLWPEPRRSIEKEWPAELKDDLEHRLCEMVCAGELEVREARESIAEDWTAAYRRFLPRAGRVLPAGEKKVTKERCLALLAELGQAGPDDGLEDLEFDDEENETEE